jgi:hypothetical protein
MFVIEKEIGSYFICQLSNLHTCTHSENLNPFLCLDCGSLNRQLRQNLKKKYVNKCIRQSQLCSVLFSDFIFIIFFWSQFSLTTSRFYVAWVIYRNATFQKNSFYLFDAMQHSLCHNRIRVSKWHVERHNETDCDSGFEFW